MNIDSKIVKYYNTSELQKKVRRYRKKPGMGQLWSGLHYLEKYRSANKAIRDKKTHKTKIDALSESFFEDCCVMSVLESIKKDKILFVELGAGWGAQSADIVGLIRNKIVNTQVKDIECLAVEAEPVHFRWLQETFALNSIKGHTLFGAVTSKPGIVPFSADALPEDSYGQAVVKKGNMIVPAFSVDYLVELLRISHIDIIHMDIQAQELETVIGAMKSIRRKKIDHFIISLHKKNLGTAIKTALSKDYDCMLDLDPRSGLIKIDGFPKPINIAQDGIQIYRRKELNYKTKSCFLEGETINWYGQEKILFPFLIDHPIKKLQDIFDLNERIFALIPWTQNSYSIQDLPKMPTIEEIYYLYNLFINKKAGGWCGLHVEFLLRVLKELGIKCDAFNYGTLDKKLTHIVAVFEFDNNRYIIDPYFGKHYESEGKPLNMKELLNYIESRNFEKIQPIYSKLLKSEEQHDKSWLEKDGKQFENTILKYFYMIGLKDCLIKNWGEDNPLLLMLNNLKE